MFRRHQARYLDRHGQIRKQILRELGGGAASYVWNWLYGKRSVLREIQSVRDGSTTRPRGPNTSRKYKIRNKDDSNIADSNSTGRRLSPDGMFYWINIREEKRLTPTKARLDVVHGRQVPRRGQAPLQRCSCLGAQGTQAGLDCVQERLQALQHVRRTKNRDCN